MKRAVIYMCILYNSFWLLKTEETLPGLDVLSTGFDAASLTGKANIFDLEDGKKSVHVQSMGKSFKHPSYVSVVTHGENSKRVEDSCTGVYRHFADYFNYFKLSFGLSLGIKTKKFLLGIHAHFDMQKIYDAITTKQQAVGVSESWWGLYDIRMPPAFLMSSKFTPQFRQAVDILKKMGVPKNEGEQNIYNQICCGAASFGTHYVGSVIVGGRVRMTTFVNSSYHKIRKESEISDQIAIGFEYKKFNLSFRQGYNKTVRNVTEDFGKNSQQHVSYQPDTLQIHNDKAPWDAWEKEVLDKPVAINKSLSSIANLFSEAPDVMKHMQKTIEFYIKMNKQPKLTDLRELLYSMGSNTNHIENIIPGIDVVGCGYDVTTLSQKKCLFKQPSSNLPRSTWSSNDQPKIVYNIPYGYFATSTPKPLELNSTVIIRSIDEYIEKSKLYERRHHSGFVGLGVRNYKATTNKYYRMLYANNYYLALSQRRLSWYTLHLLEFPLPLYSESFKAALDYLPTVYDERNKTHVALFEMFFESFGTDVVISADMGGMISAETWFESCLTDMHPETCIINEVQKKWRVLKKHPTTESCSERISEDMNDANIEFKEYLNGISSNFRPANQEKWVRSVKRNPRPIRYFLSPIYYLLYDSHPKKTALIVATNNFLKGCESKKESVIDTLKSVRPSPSRICKNKNSRLKNEPNRLFASMFSNSRRKSTKTDKRKKFVFPPGDVLCPFVGYHGEFCPVKYRQRLRSNANSYRSLPRGVGITIDLTTGKLKLPALKYEDSSSAWIDPLSGVNFSIPYDVSLSIEGDPHLPHVRLFNTVEELANVWEKGFKNGKWLGGEFGQRKSVLELYKKFFSKNQKTSIDQYPHPLYNLTLTGKWEKRLNEYVITSLRALPQKYDSNAYNRFMNAWGTHIATKTLVGGIREQLVTMKDCISKDSSNELSDAQLKKYLEMDLANIPIADSFYKARRRMSINHLIGGNPELSDEKQWIQSLSQNPVLIKIHASVDWATVSRNAGITSNAVSQNLKRSFHERMIHQEQKNRRERGEVKEMMNKSPQSDCQIIKHGSSSQHSALRCNCPSY